MPDVAAVPAAAVSPFAAREDGSFLLQEADAQSFLDTHFELLGAPLKNVSTKIDDNAKGDTPPHITVKPPLGIG